MLVGQVSFNETSSNLSVPTKRLGHLELSLCRETYLLHGEVSSLVMVSITKLLLLLLLLLQLLLLLKELLLLSPVLSFPGALHIDK